MHIFTLAKELQATEGREHTAHIFSPESDAEPCVPLSPQKYRAGTWAVGKMRRCITKQLFVQKQD